MKESEGKEIYLDAKKVRTLKIVPVVAPTPPHLQQILAQRAMILSPVHHHDRKTEVQDQGGDNQVQDN